MSVQVLPLDKDSEEQWIEYCNHKQATFYAHPNWRALIKDVFGHDSYYFLAKNERGDIVGILPLVRLKSLLFGDYLVSMPYFNYGGIIADDEEVYNALIQKADNLLKDQKSAHVELRQEQEIPVNNPVRTDKVSMILDLPEDPDELWKAIGSKRRAQVKRPIREGATFVRGGEELLDDFYNVFSQNMRDLGTPVYSKKFFESIVRTFPDNASIAVTYLNEEPVGAGFLLKSGDLVEIPWASTKREFNRFGINMFLYWNILKSSIEDGSKVFDFGRSSKDSGTLKFKKQWGATEKQLYWYYSLPGGKEIPVLNHSNKKFELMISVWKKMPLWLCNFIGPHIIKGLP